MPPWLIEDIGDARWRAGGGLAARGSMLGAIAESRAPAAFNGRGGRGSMQARLEERAAALL